MSTINNNTKAGNSTPEKPQAKPTSKKTSRSKAKNSNKNSNSHRRDGSPRSEYVLLHEVVTDDNGNFSGYKFERAARVILPNGKSQLMPLEEYLEINFNVQTMGILPYVLRVLDSENKKCAEFLSTELIVSQHSAESKLRRYLANRPEETSVALSNQLNGSRIESQGKPDSKS